MERYLGFIFLQLCRGKFDIAKLLGNRFTIIKRDADTQELLSGAAFAVKDGAGNTVGDKDAYVTGSDGSVTLTGLTPNMTVMVSEETAPAGYWNGSPLKTAVLPDWSIFVRGSYLFQPLHLSIK